MIGPPCRLCVRLRFYVYVCERDRSVEKRRTWGCSNPYREKHGETVHGGVSVVFREAFGNLAQKNGCRGLCKHVVEEADLFHLWQLLGS